MMHDEVFYVPEYIRWVICICIMFLSVYIYNNIPFQSLPSYEDMKNKVAAENATIWTE
jgi:hypothetical protein